MNEVWIEPEDAVSQLSEVFAGLAKPLIIYRLRHERMKLRASKIDSYIDYGDFRKLKPPRPAPNTTGELASLYARLPNSVCEPSICSNLLKASVTWQDDVDNWCWPDGAFRVTISIKPLPLRLMFHDVRFLQSEVSDRKRFRRYVDSVLAELPKLARTRATKWDWEGMLVALVAKAHLDGLDLLLDPTVRGEHAKLVEWMRGHFIEHTGDAPDKSQLTPRATAILRLIDSYKTLK